MSIIMHESELWMLCITVCQLVTIYKFTALHLCFKECIIMLYVHDISVHVGCQSHGRVCVKFVTSLAVCIGIIIYRMSQVSS